MEHTLQPEFLPTSRLEMDRLGWDTLDVVIVTGDAYVDHPSFGAAIVGRALVAQGFKVGIIPQPDLGKDDDLLSLGRPRLFFGVTAGNMDSMLNHYTAQRKIRSNDAYSPEDKPGLRPDRATLVYTQNLHRLFKGTPVVIGGIEAGMRRIPHYDYWSDKVRNSILFDSKAQLLVYGMAEKTITTIAQRLADGAGIEALTDLPGTVCSVKEPDVEPCTMLPPLDECRDPDAFLSMSRQFHRSFNTTTIFQPFAGRYLKHNVPVEPMTTEELDALYSLPFARRPHPMYGNREIPAYTQIKDSVTSHRGCFGGCAFCVLGYHQGKTIRSRSIASITDEIRRIAASRDFGGTISDVGGPTANMYGMGCRKDLSRVCPRDSCLYPEICANLNTSHESLKNLLNACRNVPRVKRLFVASGIRHDLALLDEGYLRELASHHTGGRLKVAPEHVSSRVLRSMHKPDLKTFEKFTERFLGLSKTAGRDQEIIPYIIVGHPGTTMRDAVELALYLKTHNMRLEQVQEFTPTPMTPSACMYYTGLDFETGKPIHVPKGREVRLQKALVQWFMPENRKYVLEALKNSGMMSQVGRILDPESPKHKKGPSHGA